MIGRGWVDEPENASPSEGRNADADRSARGTGDDEPERVWTNEDFTVDNDLADDEVTADDLVVGLPTHPVVGPAIRRTVRWWCAAGLVGLLVGAAVFTMLPPPYKAASSVLLSQSAAANTSDAMLTEVAIAQSHAVAEAAMRKLGVPVNAESVQSFLADYTAASQSVGPDGVLQFTAKASSSSTAVDRAQAVAEAFLQVRNSELDSQLTDTIRAIDQQVGQDKQQVSLLRHKIHALSAQPASPARQARIAGLQARRKLASGILVGLTAAATSYQTTTKVANASVVHGSEVLDRAVALPRSRLKYPVLYLGGGLGGGLVLGLGLVAVLALVSTRLRRRDDVARALGAPVRLSLGRARLGRRGMAAASNPEIRQIVAHLRRLMPRSSSGPATLALVALDAPDFAAVALVSLAMSYAREGKRVIVADLTPNADASSLLGSIKPGVHNVTADGLQLVIARPEADDMEPLGPLRGSASGDAHRPSRSLDRVYAAAEVLVTLTMLDPAFGADHLATWTSSSAVVLTAGESTGTKIHTIGQMIRLAGVSVVSAILLGADKSDVSLGVPDPREPGLTPDEMAEQATPAVTAGLAEGRDGVRGQDSARSQIASTTGRN
jgi:capsular polysaccharide biosynthesis protein